MGKLFLSTLSLRRATPGMVISIGTGGVSIHALLAESDSDGTLALRMQLPFLSTLSLRRATWPGPYLRWTLPRFYPRSPCGERQIPNQREIDQKSFYPRSPCGERPVFFIIFNACCTFLSTLSLRRATGRHRGNDGSPVVSIHALLAESDIPLALLCRLKLSFYPRSPCGERPQLASYFCQRLSFYPRSPCGERPLKKLLLKRLLVVSIHALLAESDACITIITICTVLFLSTLSLRRATSKDEH